MQLKRGHLIIAEDELLIAHNTRLRLEAHGYTVDGIAQTGEAALQMLESTRPDLILMDIRLAGQIDGIEAADQIRRDYHIPVVFLTGFADDETIQRAKITEPFGYISKPFDDRDLMNTVEIAIYRQKMRSALEASEARFRGLFENAVVGMVLIDHEEAIVAVNQAMLGLVGLEHSGSPETADALRSMVEAAQSSDGWTEHTYTIPDGDHRLLRITSAQIPRAPRTPPYTALFVEDVTELRRYEQELRDSQMALRALFINEEAIRSREQTRLSRDIHDVIGQMLTAHKMDLHWMKSKQKDDGSVAGIDEMIVHIDEIICFVKRICSELRDNVLDDFGFDDALDGHLDQFRDRTGLAVTLARSNGEIDLEHDRAVSLLRIIQEALTNIARHANASAVSIRSIEQSGTMIWTIEDDGVGFDTSAVDMASSLGIVGMYERAGSWGGSVRISSEPGHGTTLRIELPKGGAP